MLTRPEFTRAARTALRDFADPIALARSPLLDTAAVACRVGVPSTLDQRVRGLQGLIRDTLAMLETAPRLDKLRRAVLHTYLEPLETQEQVAALLALPFSTYRRHLTTGVTRVVERLWQLEIERV